MGLGETPLFRILNDRELEVPLPVEGVMLSAKLGELLDVREGDTVTVEVLEGKRPRVELEVAWLVDDFSGLNAYVQIDNLHRMMQEDRLSSGVFLRIDASKTDQVYEALKELPQVAAVNVKTAMLQSFEETMAENLLRMRGFNIMFATIIAFGVVYNSARISLAERSRELSTLRVIGFTRAEVSQILLGELGLLTILALPVGLLMGYGLAAWMTLGLDTEIYRIPLVIQPQTYAYSSLVVIIASAISGLIVRRKIDRLDLISVLKSKE